MQNPNPKTSAPKLHVLIPAAGTGSRMASSTPKQYLPLAGNVVMAHTINVFLNAPNIYQVHVILSAEDAVFNTLNMTAARLQLHYCGGASRAETVLNGLQAIESQVADDDWVLVHDAARPGLSDEALQRLISALENDSVGGLLALPLADTLKRAEKYTDNAQKVSTTIPRADLWQAQTPQMFKYNTLKIALQQFNGVPTDEAEAIEALGLKPTLVVGELRNLKVTYPQDLAVVTALMNVKINTE